MKTFVVLCLALATVSAASLDAVVQPSFASGRIINGYPAKKGEATFIVSLRTSSHFCAGSLIAPNWVMTAAHCLGSSPFTVVAGLHSRNDESDTQIREVKGSDQIIHEKYKGGVGPYDIGLIHIAAPFNINALTREGLAPVAKISLPSGKYKETGPGILYGWGRDNSGALPNELQKLDALIINSKECKRKLPLLAPIAASNICTYKAGTADGSCNGDSGGPLVIQTPDGYEQVGIVSWGYVPCATTQYPSVYTQVSAHKSWIGKKISKFRAAD